MPCRVMAAEKGPKPEKPEKKKAVKRAKKTVQQ